MKSDNSDVIITWKKHTKKDAINMPNLAYSKKKGKYKMELQTIL